MSIHVVSIESDLNGSLHFESATDDRETGGGYYSATPLTELSLEEWHEAMKLNFETNFCILPLV